MSAALEAVRVELADLRAQVGRLECAEALLTGAGLPTTQPQTIGMQSPPIGIQPHPASRSTTADGVKAGARGLSSKEIREYVVAHAPVTRRQLIDALGGKPQRIDNALKRMVASGAIIADGERGKRGATSRQLRSRVSPGPQIA